MFLGVAIEVVSHCYDRKKYTYTFQFEPRKCKEGLVR